MLAPTFLIVAAAAGSAPVQVYGIVIGQPLTMAECRPKPPSAADEKLAKKLAQRGIANFLTSLLPAYEPAGATPCYKRLSKQVLGTPIGTEKLHVEFPAGERLAANGSYLVALQMVEGRVQFLRFGTRGRQWQDEDLATFTSKFGPPKTVAPVQLQNGFGATYQALRAIWNPADGIVATFSSWISDQRGDFSIGTPAAERLFWDDRPTVPTKAL